MMIILENIASAYDYFLKIRSSILFPLSSFYTYKERPFPVLKA